MRWNNLFDDLESQLEHELEADEVDLKAEEERLRIGRLSLRDRLMAMHKATDKATGGVIRVVMTNGTTVRVRPVNIGKDWMSGDLVEESARRSQAVLAFSAIAGVLLEASQVEPSLGRVGAPGASGTTAGLSARLSLAFVLRDLCRRRCAVELVLAGGTVHGTIDRVGRDHCDVAVHEPGTARRESSVSQFRLVPFGQLLLVRL